MTETNKGGVCCCVFLIFLAIAFFTWSFETNNTNYNLEFLLLGIAAIGLLYFYGWDHVEYYKKNFGDFETRIARSWKNKRWSVVGNDRNLSISECKIKTFKNAHEKRIKTDISNIPLGNNRIKQYYRIANIEFSFTIVEFVFPSEKERKNHDPRIRNYYKKYSYSGHLEHFTEKICISYIYRERSI